MSQESVELVRAAIEALNRGDWDAALRDATPDFAVDNSTALGEWRGVHRGAEEVRRMWSTMAEPWETVELEMAEVYEARDDLVVANIRARFVGRDGIELPVQRAGWVFRLEGGKLARLEYFNDLDDAFRAAGLEPPA